MTGKEHVETVHPFQPPLDVSGLQELEATCIVHFNDLCASLHTHAYFEEFFDD